MKMKAQEKTRWCWAAVTQAIAAKYGGHYSQTEIAGIVLKGNINGCKIPNANCNLTRKIDKALILNDIATTYIEGPTTPERANREISNGNPFAMAIHTLGGADHVVLVFGMEGEKFKIWDPDLDRVFILDAMGIAQELGEWRQTIFTKKGFDFKTRVAEKEEDSPRHLEFPPIPPIF